MGTWRRCFCVQDEVHQEDEAIKTFLAKNEFIAWANRRDKRLERRWVSLDSAIRALEELRDDCEIPTKEYNRRIGEIKDKF